MSILLRESSGFVVPGVITDVVGSTDFDKAFGGITGFSEIGRTSLYYNRIQGIATMTKVTQTWSSERNNQSFTLSQIKLPRYILTSYYMGDDIKEAVFNNNVKGVSFRNLLDDCCIQGISQKIRFGALYGFQAGQGLLAYGGTFTFGNDVGGNSTLVTYDSTFVRNKLIAMIRQLLSDVKNNTDSIVIFSSRRVINHIDSEVVSLLESQKPGAGIDSIGGSIKRIVKESFNIDCEFILDDTLENANQSGDKDILAVIAKGFKQEVRGEKDVAGNINIVAEGNNTIKYNTTMDIGYGGRTMEKRNPDMNQQFSGYHCAVVTPGVSLRNEAVIKTEIKYA